MPAAGNVSQETLLRLVEGKLEGIVRNQPLTDIEKRVTAVEAGKQDVGGVTVASASTIGAGGAAVQADSSPARGAYAAVDGKVPAAEYSEPALLRYAGVACLRVQRHLWLGA